MSATYLSFQSGIVRPIFDLEKWPLREQVIQRCETMQQDAKVLDENYAVMVVCRFRVNGCEYEPQTFIQG